MITTTRNELVSYYGISQALKDNSWPGFGLVTLMSINEEVRNVDYTLCNFYWGRINLLRMCGHLEASPEHVRSAEDNAILALLSSWRASMWRDEWGLSITSGLTSSPELKACLFA